MNILLDFFRGIRIGNLLLIAIAQFLLVKKLDSSNFPNFEFLPIILMTCYVALLGNLENNILDYRLDRECKLKAPNRFVEFFLNNQRLRIFELLFLIGFGLFEFSSRSLVIIVSSYLLLKYYNHKAKKYVVIGNLMIGILCGLSIFIIDMGEFAQKYALLIALFTIIREMIKDKEDENCDRLYGYSTLPIRMSENGFRILLIVVILLVQAWLFIMFPCSWFLFSMFSGIIILLYSISRGLWKAASLVVKCIIGLGILSILS